MYAGELLLSFTTGIFDATFARRAPAASGGEMIRSSFTAVTCVGVNNKNGYNIRVEACNIKLLARHEAY